MSESNSLRRVQKGYDRLASVYHILEYALLGAALSKVRREALSGLEQAESVLLLGDGDGRFLKELLQLNPRVNVLSVDCSAQMIARAEARLSDPERGRVMWIQADAQLHPFPADTFDAVVSLFFWDQFSAQQQAPLAESVVQGLKPGGRLHYADFCEGGRSRFARLRNRLWLKFLYSFFNQVCRLGTARLCSPEQVLLGCGMSRKEQQFYSGGLLERAVYLKSEKPD